MTRRADGNGEDSRAKSGREGAIERAERGQHGAGLDRRVRVSPSDGGEMGWAAPLGVGLLANQDAQEARTANPTLMEDRYSTRRRPGG